MLAVVELPPTSAGVVIVVGCAALLAGLTGATVKIAGNELGAKGKVTRALTGLLGFALVAWSAWSMREKPFEVTRIAGTRMTLMDANSRTCAAKIEVAVVVGFHHAPGWVRWEVYLGRGLPPEIFRQRLKQVGSGTDMLGPETLRVPPGHAGEPLRPQVIIVAPNIVTTRDFHLGGPQYFSRSVQRCQLT